MVFTSIERSSLHDQPKCRTVRYIVLYTFECGLWRGGCAGTIFYYVYVYMSVRSTVRNP